MIEFRLKADISFMADGIDDALLRLAEHFRQEGTYGEDSHLLESGQVLVGRLGDARFDGSDSLDAAWAEAEAALPEGWWIARIELSGMTTEDMGGHRGRLTWWEAWASGPKGKDAKGVADTPVAALRALVAKLREVA